MGKEKVIVADTVIVSNGPKTILPLEDLFALLEKHQLDSAHNGIVDDSFTYPGRKRIYGKFAEHEETNHPFFIWTDDPSVIDKFTLLFQANHRRADYQRELATRARSVQTKTESVLRSIEDIWGEGLMLKAVWAHQV
jgi:hypothetical protein